VDLYIHSPIRIHGVVLNELSTGTTSPFFTFTVKLGILLIERALTSQEMPCYIQLSHTLLV
jgi:hypothetical protein